MSLCNRSGFVFAVGETLAYFEEDARRFLFPEPKLVPSFSGVEREALMTRAPHFPVGVTLAIKICIHLDTFSLDL